MRVETFGQPKFSKMVGLYAMPINIYISFYFVNYPFTFRKCRKRKLKTLLKSMHIFTAAIYPLMFIFVYFLYFNLEKKN